MLFTVLVVLILIVALLMGLVILLQNGKGGGLAGIASGGQTTQILGARQAPDFLEKATWTLGGSFLVLCLLTSLVIPRSGAGRSILQERAGDLPAAPAPGATLPGAPAAPGGAPGTPAPGTAAPGAATAPAQAPQATPVTPAPPPAPAQ